MTAIDIGELLPVLLRATVALSVAAVAVIALRLPLRRAFGPGVAYAAWMAVPLCALAALLPAAPTGSVLALHAAPAAQPLAAAMRGLAQAPSSASGLTLLAWLAGALYFAARQMRQQRAYMRSQGKLTRRGDIAYSDSLHAGPALVGLWRPIIVVPADFDRRYTSRERELIVAHERTHANRHDPLANAASAALRCLNWFNPLVHIAERLMRADQELACDAEVVRSHPNARRNYATAMLKTQLSVSEAPLACQWQSTHPLKERIVNLNRTTPYALRLTGRFLIAIAMAGGSLATWAAQQTPTGPLYDVAVKLDIGGASSAPHLHTRAGETATLRSGDGAQQWETKLTLKPADNGKVFISSSVKHSGKEVGNPGLLVALGEPGTVRIELDDKSRLEMQLTVTQLAQ
ncbi:MULTISPECIES: M56 family metallopeptidase [unclassified Duganella]|uniref:M56 family metallopeptidase n=1 Tax=unclassified Duganella TaxID=2636909 RepID=UPI000E355544|nr:MULTISPECIES: M56 family metallopeptidase [unclassified Duganella]RFP19373.1 energy transducer TonB [Duganella sp. BJB475]RFP35954.1 energy transducer TonB [Duganella sp. BJB476]